MSDDPKGYSLRRIAGEPPIRLLTQAALRFLPCSIRRKAAWDTVRRPEYLVGLLEGADQAVRQSLHSISALEFGVAGGNGLVALQEYAASIERETGVSISVYGFDTGQGLPNHCGDYRDHPNCWKLGDYQMDEAALRRRLHSRTELVLGDISHTVPEFVSKMQKAPLGFVAVDVDYYSSAQVALTVLSMAEKKMLYRVPMVFDDVDSPNNHRFAGELRAIEEFNLQNNDVKIDRWRGVYKNRAFHEAEWLRRMYMAHDLAAISKTVPPRENSAELPLR